MIFYILCVRYNNLCFFFFEKLHQVKALVIKAIPKFDLCEEFDQKLFELRGKKLE